MAFKLIEAAQNRWRAVNGPHLVALVRAGPRQSRDGWVLSCGDVGGGGGCGHRLGVIMRVSNPCSRQEACVRSVSVSDRCCSGRPGGRS